MIAVRVSRSESRASYVVRLSKLGSVLENEFWEQEVGDKVTLELVEIDEVEFEALEEFQGW